MDCGKTILRQWSMFKIPQESGFPVNCDDCRLSAQVQRMPPDLSKISLFILTLTAAVSLVLVEEVTNLLSDAHEAVFQEIHNSVTRKTLEVSSALDEILLICRIGQTN